VVKVNVELHPSPVIAPLPPDADGNSFWLSAPKPIAAGTGPFVGDLQSWTRDEALDPDPNRHQPVEGRLRLARHASDDLLCW
jgi:hypothetical protein